MMRPSRYDDPEFMGRHPELSRARTDFFSGQRIPVIGAGKALIHLGIGEPSMLNPRDTSPARVAGYTLYQVTSTAAASTALGFLASYILT